jgi:CheY-like chemotaxis protein
MYGKERFAGLRVLIAEDEALSAMEMEALLQELGCRVVGPLSRVEAILPKAGDIDCALLDIDLRGHRCYEAAQSLRDRGVSVAFVTGYTEMPDCPAGLEALPRLRKPFDRRELVDVLDRLAGGARSADRHSA